MRLVITGAAGFIGNFVANYLQKEGHEILAVDIGKNPENCKQFPGYMPHDFFLEVLQNGITFGETNAPVELDAIIHLGACADTTCMDKALLTERNVEYSKRLWEFCVKQRKRFIYASSAATYGNGSVGFDDSTDKLNLYKPLNYYAESKHEFDLWVIENCKKLSAPPAWAGLKFFNVYGPNEEHKGKMASMIHQGFKQAKEDKRIKLFKYGHQQRDFIYVGDVARVIEHLLGHHNPFAIYNVGTGQARSFNEMAQAVFVALGIKLDVEYVDIPESLIERYQSFTEAKIDKLRRTGFPCDFLSLEDGCKLTARMLEPNPSGDRIATMAERG